MPLPPSPNIPRPSPGGPSPGGTSPAAPQQADRAGKQARGGVVAGLGLEMLRIAIPLLGNSEEGLVVTEAVAKLAKKFAKPPADLGASELKFMQSQLGAGGGGPAAAANKPAMPPTPAPPPGAGAPPMADAA